MKYFKRNQKHNLNLDYTKIIKKANPVYTMKKSALINLSKFQDKNNNDYKKINSKKKSKSRLTSLVIGSSLLFTTNSTNPSLDNLVDDEDKNKKILNSNNDKEDIDKNNSEKENESYSLNYQNYTEKHLLKSNIQTEIKNRPKYKFNQNEKIIASPSKVKYIIKKNKTIPKLIKVKSNLENYVLQVIATAYEPSAISCGKYADGITYTGHKIKQGDLIVAVDPKIIPLGSKVYVPGYGLAYALDIGGAIKGNRIDVLFTGNNAYKKAIKWGRKKINISYTTQ